MLIVTNGLVHAAEELRLHPLLSPLQAELSGRAQRWFSSGRYTPLSLIARLQERPVAALIASQADLPEAARQCWVASPFHAQLVRDRLQVMPEGLMPWAADDAEALVALLNPLLAEEGMQLVNVGSALLLSCREPLDAQPLSFAGIAGHLLPNRHPEGAEGGRLMRLLAEIQMFLYRNPLAERRQRGEPDVRGLWLWGGCELPLVDNADIPSIATRSPFLASLSDGREAKLTVTEAEQLDQLIRPSLPLPPDILLLGHGHALWLTPSTTAAMLAKLRPSRSGGVLSPRRINGEAELLRLLQERL